MPPWKPGQSGNPNGRPKKKRALTDVLERSLSHAVVLPDGTKINGKRYIADLIRQGLTTGAIVLASGETITVGTEDFFILLKFIYNHIDGPPPAQVTGEDGGPIKILVEYASDENNSEE